MHWLQYRVNDRNKFNQAEMDICRYSVAGSIGECGTPVLVVVLPNCRLYDDLSCCN